MPRFLNYLHSLVLGGLGVGAACLACSSSSPSATECTVDSQCKGDRICGPEGKCIDDSVDPSSEGGAGSQTQTRMNGDPCTTSGSNCDPTCLESCGASASCVDLCCPDTKGTGILCNGQCIAPKCKKGDTSASWTEFKDRSWTCYEAKENGATYCDCTNSFTAAELMTQGKTLVTSCSDAFCRFELDSPDLDCRCRPTGTAPSPNGVCSSVCAGIVASCTTPLVFTCDDPCKGLTFK